MVIWIILSDEKFICVVFSLWQGEVLISPAPHLGKPSGLAPGSGQQSKIM
jgi:hypothetical protein